MVNIKGSYSIQSYTHISLQYYLAFQSQTEKIYNYCESFKTNLKV